MDLDSTDFDIFTTLTTRNSAQQLSADEQSERTARLNAARSHSAFADPWSGSFPVRRLRRDNSRRLAGGPNRF